MSHLRHRRLIQLHLLAPHLRHRCRKFFAKSTLVPYPGIVDKQPFSKSYVIDVATITSCRCLTYVIDVTFLEGSIPYMQMQIL